MDFGTILKKILKLKGISQSELARQLGVQQTTVNKWCIGRSQPNLDTLMEISSILDEPIQVFFDFNELEDLIFNVNTTDERVDNKFKLLINTYENLSDAGQDYILGYMQSFLEREREERREILQISKKIKKHKKIKKEE